MQRTMLIYVSCQLVDNRAKNPPPTTTTTTTTKVGKAQERKARTIGANWYQLSGGPAPSSCFWELDLSQLSFHCRFRSWFLFRLFLRFHSWHSFLVFLSFFSRLLTARDPKGVRKTKNKKRVSWLLCFIYPIAGYAGFVGKFVAYMQIIMEYQSTSKKALKKIICLIFSCSKRHLLVRVFTVH